MRIKAYTPFIGAGIQDMLAYRMNFLFFFIGNILFTFVLYFLWKAVFAQAGSTQIHDFSLFEMTAYLFISNITSVFASTDSSYTVGEEIVEGSISMRLIKPVSYDLSLMAQELGCMVVKFFMILLPVILGIEVFRYFQSGVIMFNIVNFLLYFLSTLLSYLILFYFNLCFGFLAFVLKNLWGFNRLKDGIIGFLSGSLIPIAFFPVWAKNILGFLPFSSMNYTPVMLYLGKYSQDQIVVAFLQQAFWLLAFYLISKFIWKCTVNQLTVQGG